MSLGRASIVSYLLGWLFIILGFITTPGLASHTVAACTTYGPAEFRGLRFSDWSIVWFDGCNEWNLSLFALIGGLYIVGSVILGGIVLYRSWRDEPAMPALT